MGNGINQSADGGLWPLSDLAVDADGASLDEGVAGIGGLDTRNVTGNLPQRDTSAEHAFVARHCCDPVAETGSIITLDNKPEPTEPRSRETMLDDICEHLGF